MSDWIISLEGTEAGHRAALMLALLAAVLHAIFGALQKGRFDPWLSRGAIDGAYGLMAVLLWQRGHRLLALLSGFWVLAVALSRIYLGAHYPSDVLASIAVGLILVIITLLIDKQLNLSLSRRG